MERLLRADGPARAAERKAVQWIQELAGRPRIRIRLWDGWSAGADASSAVGTFVVHSRPALYRVLLGGDLAVGDAFSRGEITVEGDLVDTLVEVFHAQESVRSRWPSRLQAIRQRRPRLNSLSGSRDNIHHHYDIGNDFYRLWLDSEMQYTCAYFPDPDLTIEQAQQAKMDHICRKLQLRPGDRVVEAGCGWGSLARHMALRYGARVRAYNISAEQVRFAAERARREGYDDRVEYVEDDYRNIDDRYDVFVSVGMLEHVGRANYPVLGAVVDRCLKDDGRALVHSIGRNRPRLMNAWIEKRIFPGAYPPTLREMMAIFEPADFSILDVENLRLHYAATLEHWLFRFDQAEDSVREMFDDDFVRAWRLYLAGSVAAFLAGNLQLFQVVLARGRHNDVPWTREHLYPDAGRRGGAVG